MLPCIPIGIYLENQDELILRGFLCKMAPCSEILALREIKEISF